MWAFLGDGECDEPETLGALTLASRENLDNLIFVVNCNLQRLDGPVRGNGKIIQELEAVFRGAGWNVIKVILGSKWDELLANDKDGVLLNQLNITVDGEFQRYGTESGAYIREHFFGPDPRLRQMVAHLSDDDLVNLPRGGHDYRKLYAAYKAASDNLGSGAPTAILCKTIKGWTLGPGFEGRNSTHQIKKMNKEQLLELRNRLYLHEEIPESALDENPTPYFRPAQGLDRVPVHDGAPSGPRRVAAAARRCATSSRSRSPTTPRSPSCAAAPAVRRCRRRWASPACCATCRATRRSAATSYRSSPTRAAPSAWTRCSRSSRSTPPRARSTSRSITACCSATPSRRPARSSRKASPRPARRRASSPPAPRTRPTPSPPSRSTSSTRCSASSGWAICCGRRPIRRTRGFLAGATAGRTTLLGEGLQHQDGHSLVLASTVPPVQAYDPAFAFEVATIVQQGLQRMYGDNGGFDPDVFYYLTLYNENYEMPAMPEHVQPADVMRGLYRWSERPEGKRHAVTLLFSGSAQKAAFEAAATLADHYDVGVELWSATSYKALRDEALAVERWNRLHPSQEPRVPVVTELLGDGEGPIVAVSDFMKVVPEQILRFVGGRTFLPLGTDGMGRSDTREALRRHFETDAGHVVVAVLSALAGEGRVEPATVEKAIAEFGIDPDLPDPAHA